MLYGRVKYNPVVNRNLTPGLRVLQYMHTLRFVHFDHREATVVLDITTQLVASDDNKYSVAT